jgi:hypothetical protein
MWATKLTPGPRRAPSSSQGGAAAVEFGLLAIVFFMFVFGVIETARTLYVFNTLQEVTRRAAAAATHVDPNDIAGIAVVKHHAIFRNTPGGLMLAPPVTDEYVRLSYLNNDLSVIPESAWPESAVRNREICMLNPRAANCIRFVQAQICKPEIEDECEAARSQMLLPLIDLRVPLHKATTIVTAESLGYVDGVLP